MGHIYYVVESVGIGLGIIRHPVLEVIGGSKTEERDHWLSYEAMHHFQNLIVALKSSEKAPFDPAVRAIHTYICPVLERIADGIAWVFFSLLPCMDTLLCCQARTFVGKQNYVITPEDKHLRGDAAYCDNCAVFLSATNLPLGPDTTDIRKWEWYCQPPLVLPNFILDHVIMI